MIWPFALLSAHEPVLSAPRQSSVRVGSRPLVRVTAWRSARRIPRLQVLHRKGAHAAAGLLALLSCRWPAPAPAANGICHRWHSTVSPPSCHRLPQGKTLLRCRVGGVHTPPWPTATGPLQPSRSRRVLLIKNCDGTLRAASRLHTQAYFPCHSQRACNADRHCWHSRAGNRRWRDPCGGVRSCACRRRQQHQTASRIAFLHITAPH